MAHDNARAVSQPVVEPSAQDIAVPAPRPPVPEAAAHDIAVPAPVPEPARPDIARPDIARPAHRPRHGFRAGWILSTIVAAAAAWVAGWVTGVSWAWRAMTPRYLRWTQNRPGAGLPGAGSPVR